MLKQERVFSQSATKLEAHCGPIYRCMPKYLHSLELKDRNHLTQKKVHNSMWTGGSMYENMKPSVENNIFKDAVNAFNKKKHFLTCHY